MIVLFVHFIFKTEHIYGILIKESSKTSDKYKLSEVNKE